MIFILSSTEKEASLYEGDSTFRFSRFLVLFRERNHKKYFAKENFCALVWSGQYPSGSQSQRGIGFILPPSRSLPGITAMRVRVSSFFFCVQWSFIIWKAI